jgi:hypothetical protein
MFRHLIHSLLMIVGVDVRGIFRFHDGLRWRWSDPWLATRLFFSHAEFDWDQTPEQLKQPDSGVQLEAIRLIAQAVRDTFQIPSFALGGLSEQECVSLLFEFRRYLGDVKKNGSLWPTSAEPTELVPTAVPRFRAKAASDCGSTLNDNCCDEPGPSVTES